MDQAANGEVWSQPAYGFAITNAVDGKIPELTKAEAVARLGQDGPQTALLPPVTLAAGAQQTGAYTATVAGPYVVKLSGTGDADLYVKKGAAPTTTDYDCRPYAATAVEECAVTLAAGEQLFWMVAGYAPESAIQLAVAVPGAGEYTYNTAAQRFFAVELEVAFVGEARAARQSHVDEYQSYVETRRYSYVLEADDHGKILGGEWAGASRASPPASVWWPTAKATYSTVAGGLINYADVKPLNDEAAGAPPPPTSDVQVAVLQSYDMHATGSWTSKYVTVLVEPGFDRILVTMSGTGAAELYVRADRNPTVYSFDCKSTASGTAVQSCTAAVPPGGKTMFIRARSKTPSTVVTISATKLVPAAGGNP
jgi:hypothetical protein